MGRKNVLKRYPVITAGDLSLASITSKVTQVQFLDNVGLQINWTGTAPVGTIAVQVSIDYDQDNYGNVINAGHWVPIALSPAPAVSGNSGQIYIDINQISAPWMRIVYTKTSGVGSVDAFISGKQIA